MNINVTEAMAGARNTMTDGAFQEVGTVLTEAKNLVREESQQKTAAAMRKIIAKLRTDEPVTAEEAELMKAWIVGDAEAYTRLENNFQDWLAEYRRLESALAAYEDRDCSSDELLALHGILEDASRVSYDIANFLEKRDRIKKFEQAMAAGLDEPTRDFFANVLAGKLHSREF